MHEIDLMLQLQFEGKHQEARALSDKLERIGPDKILDPNGENTTDIWLRHSFNRGWFLIQEGDYQKGCQLLENGRFLSVYGSPQLRTNAPLYNPKQHNLVGKSIIISLEGGFGDEIIHARFATSYKKLGAKHVYLATAPELVSVCERIEGVDKVILRNQIHTVQHDYWLPGFSSGWVAGHTFDNFPNDAYLTALPEKLAEWNEKLKTDKIKVGIRWAGNPQFEHQQFRRFPENFITNLSKYNELQLYSFQRDTNLVDLPSNIVDLQNDLISWEDTLAAIMNVDIMITSCTSIAHASAALGKETWVIVPILPYHTWTYKSPHSRTSPYYKTVKLFRQTKKAKWNDTFQLLYKELEEKFNLTHVEMPNEDPNVTRLNLGSGIKKIPGFVNVDANPLTKPDVVWDLNTFPWPFEDNSFDHIIGKDILEHLGKTTEDFVKVIQEMYRISRFNAIWEIQCPHWRSDIAIDDPEHIRLITPGMFDLFNKNTVIEDIRSGGSSSILAFKHDVDISVENIQYEFGVYWQDKINKKEITKEELQFALTHYNNVAYSVKYLIQVHKPGRITHKEFTETLEKAMEEENKRIIQELEKKKNV